MTTKIKHIASNVITTTELDTSSLDSHFSGGTGVTYSAGAISIGQAVHSTDSPTFADLTITGNLNITGNIDQYNVTDLDVTDKTITLGSGQIEANSGGSGIIIDGSGASILWDETNTEWDFNSRINTASVFSPYYSIRESGTQYGFIGQYKTLSGAGTDTSLTIFSETGDGINFAVNGSVTKAVVIDSEGDVGIGTDTPAYPLDIDGSIRIKGVGRQLLLDTTGSGASNQIKVINDYETLINCGRGSAGFAVIGNSDIRLGFGTAYNAAQTKLYINGSSGNVGIGTTSLGTYQLSVNSGTAGTSNALAGIFVEGQRNGVVYNLVSNNTSNGADKGSGIQFRSGGFLSSGIIGRSDAVAASGDAPGYLTFHTSTDGSEDFTERMRIDSLGNVGIGSSPVIWSNGMRALELKGYSGVTKQGSLAFVSHSGSNGYNLISTDTGNMVFYNGPTDRASAVETVRISSSGTATFADDVIADAFLPTTAGAYGSNHVGVHVSGVVLNAATSQTGYIMSAGSAVMTFAPTGGTIQLGGLTAANKLDDYEEGTWTPAIAGATSTTATGKYTKTGNVVNFKFRLAWNSLSGTLAALTGLPFAADSSNESMGISIYSNSGFGTPPTNKGYLAAYVASSGTTINFSWQPNTADANFTSSGNMYVAGMYFTA